MSYDRAAPWHNRPEVLGRDGKTRLAFWDELTSEQQLKEVEYNMKQSKRIIQEIINEKTN